MFKKSIFIFIVLTFILANSLLTGFSASAKQPSSKVIINEQTTKSKKNKAQGNTAQQAIEKITINHSKTTRSLNESFAVDNTLLYPENMINPQRSIADVMAQSIGINFNGQGGLFQSYNIRGFSRARIKTEVDGIPIFTDRRAGNSLSFIPNALISSIYIQKGPQSTLYGSGAMGGVVSISTYSTEPSSIALQHQLQNNGNQVVAKYNSNNFWASVLQRSAVQANSPEREQGESTKLNSQYHQVAANFATEFQWRGLDVFASNIISSGKDIGKSSALFPKKRVSNYPKDDHWLSQIQLTSPGKWKLKFFQHQQHWQSKVIRLNKQQLFSRENLTNYESSTYGVNSAWLVGNTHMGLEWFARKNINISEQEFTQTQQLAWQKQTVSANEKTISAFVVHDWSLADVDLTSGARFDKITLAQYQQQKDDSFLSLSSSAHYALTTKTKLKIQIANAFRFPTVSELFFSGETPRGNTQGNPTLTPEKSLGMQISINHQVTDDFQTTINAYHYTIDDYIERYRQQGTRYYRNNQNVVIDGFEINNQWQITPQWHTSLGYQWQQAKDEENNVVDDAIPNAIKWTLQWQGELVTFSQQMNFQFSEANVGPSEIPQDHEFIWHSRVDYQIKPKLLLSFAVINITDNLYRSSRDEDAPFQAERSITLSAKWQF